MPIKHLSFQNVKAKEMNYADQFFELKKQVITPSDSFSFNYYQAFNDINDFKTNNYSNLFLTKLRKNSEWLYANDLDTKSSDFSTTLSFNITNESNLKDTKRWLFFDKKYEQFDFNMTEIGYSLKSDKPQKNYYNFIFFLDFINQNECKISHTYGNKTFYLSAQESLDIKFLSEPNEGQNIFIYQKSGTTIKLYKKIKSEESEKLYILGLITLTDGASYALKLLDREDDGNVILNFHDATLDYDFYINGSWVSYNRQNALTEINSINSAYNLQTQVLLHHEYNKQGEINIIPLKNNLSYKGNSIRGNNMTISANQYPDVDFRIYTSINSGFNQQKGNQNIILTFNFNDQEIDVNAGDVVHFNIPHADGTTNLMSPLWPYKQINLNDTKFVKNGAFASDVPFFSDKIKKLQDGKRLNSNIKNVGNYLCSWLYKEKQGDSGVWMDRYYYPDMISREKALTSKVFKPSFSHILTENYLKDEDNKKTIHQNTYFDKISDVVLQPGGKYIYQRISNNNIAQLVQKLQQYRIKSAKNKSKKKIDLLQQFVFDNKNYNRIDFQQWNKTNAINLNFDLYINPDKRMGIQLFGTDYGHGFNIQNRKDVVPFHYYANEKTIYLCNNSMTIVHRFNLYQKYEQEIITLILGQPFGDIIAVTNYGTENTKKYNLYIFTYDLILKSKINLSDEFYYSPSEEPIPNKDDYNWKNAILHNNNIYIPAKKCIIKVILNPQNKKDNSAIGNKTVAYRKLQNTEFKKNFNEQNTDERIYINGVVQADAHIKTLYFDQNNFLYAFNYQKIAPTIDGDTIYGLFSPETYVNSGGWCWLFNESLGKMKVEGNQSQSKVPQYASDVSIDAVQFNESGQMCLIRGFNKISTDLTSDSKNSYKRMQIYDISKKLIYTYSLQNYDKLISLDWYNYIDVYNNQQQSFTALVSTNDNYIYAISYNTNQKNISMSYLDSQGTPAKYFNKTTNGNACFPYSNQNAIYFNLYLPTQYYYGNKAFIKWDIKDVNQGWYNINVSIDLVNAIFQVKINDKVIGTITSADNQNFKKYQNANGTIFDSSYYIGCLGKKYGISSNDILKNSLTDPYICKNGKMKNLAIYRKTLSLHQYQAIRMRDKKVNKLILTLPCGIRNSIDEMIRYFRYCSPNYVTNKVKINISGIPLNEIGDTQMLKTQIKQALKNNIDGLVKVHQISII